MVSRLALGLLAVTSSLALSSHALAQASTTGLPEGEAAQGTTAEPTQADGTQTTTGDVIVTGSRVVRNGDAAPTPVTLVRTEDLLRQTPSTVADGLNALPVFSGGRGPATQIQTTGNAAGGNGAANQLNLRGLGAIRNLILFDNQRLPTALFNGVVDVDIVPDPLIERVDVVTGGVSAVYGSDAISGVVNFVTNKTFTGVKLEADAGISQRGDAPQQKISVTGGTKLGDRAHIEASYTYIHSDPIPFRSNRPFALDYAYGGLLLPTSTYGAAGTATNPYVLIRGGRNSSASVGGKITGLNAAVQTALGLGSGANGYNFAGDGVLALFNPGQVTASTNLSIGGDGYLNNASLGATQNSHAAFGRFDYEVSDAVHFHTQGILNIKDNEVFGNYGVFTNFTIRATNPYLPTSLRNALAAGNQPFFTFAKALTNGPRLNDQVHTSQYYINAGLDGTFGSFDWAIDGNYGKAKLHNRLGNNVNNQHLAAAADAVVNGSGQIVCGINADAITTNDDASCAPANLFGPTAISQAAYNYIFQTVNLWATTENLAFNGHIGGELFDLLGAGAARFALSGEYRRTSLTETVDYSSTDTANCSGLAILTTNTATTRSYASNCVPAGATSLSTNAAGVQTVTPLTPTALFVNAFAPLSKKTQEVKEVALEVLLPVLRDSVVARELDVTGAVRYADYNTTGSTWVWKGGVSWQLFDSLRFRGTVSRDFRAPTLNDLYQPITVQVAGNADLLTGVAFLQSRTQGNPDLKPEVGHTWTVGAVFKPDFIPGFSVAVDYYHIRITDAIQQVQGLTPAVQSACLASGGSSPFCLLQPRPNGYTDTSPSNAPFYWLTQNLNFAEITTEGVDTDVSYATRLLGRPLGARLLVTWQPHVIYANQPGNTSATTTFDAAGTANADGTINFIAAKWRINGSVHVEPVDGFSLDVRERWRSGYRYNPVATTFFAQRVKSLALTDLSTAFKMPGGGYEFYVNVQNLFDKKPPAFQQGILPGQGFVPGDDYVGRYYLAGIRAKF